ncbi:3-hydroxyacyl-CoA dehydrogenase, NAD binding domain protein [Opisthorchis viverrini]|uniref:3-hydroxyacyl-CoA dehydrogenase, NAD binding domain protein n=1 Tax=Opisthorchis viverrini TaxID=6198 RepID=A0A1S8WWH5_OPIVI|nr:3-hydroxyacyl-CoA dehydrogenase, NAD binding domain protein [Opisthorchis viverrini]
MGTGIAQVCVQNGYAVNLIDLDQSVLSKSVDAIRQNAHRFAKKKYPNDESSAASFVDSCLANLGTYTCIKEAVHGADLVIEAIVEKLPAKQSLFLSSCSQTSSIGLMCNALKSLQGVTESLGRIPQEDDIAPRNH